jgi:uncharacterized DUF497 family protein
VSRIFVYTKIVIRFEFDPIKNGSNFDKHGLPLTEAEGFEWETDLVCEDTRRAYAEKRFEAIGYIGTRLHVMVFCIRSKAIRVISLRKANQREVTSYAQT